MQTMREEMNTDNLKAIAKGRQNVGHNGIHKETYGASFQSKDFNKACGNPLLKAWAERKIVKCS